MRKVSGLSPDGVFDKKEKRNSARSLVNMEEKKGGKEVGKQRIGEKKRARKEACEGAQSNPLLFIW